MGEETVVETSKLDTVSIFVVEVVSFSSTMTEVQAGNIRLSPLGVSSFLSHSVYK